MPNHKSAKKRMRQSEKRRLRNRSVRSTVRTETKKMRQVIEGTDKAAIEQQLKTTSKVIDKAASKGVLKKETASRRISRLAKQAHAKLAPPAQS